MRRACASLAAPAQPVAAPALTPPPACLSPQRPGEFTRFDFPPGVPAPFGMAAAILGNTTMLTWPEKLQVGVPLLPMMVGGQDYIDAQDELSVLEWMRKNGMPERMNDEVFIAMAKALDFIDPDKLSMTVILTAMNRFINETSGSRVAFLDGNQPERLCKPLRQHIEAHGGSVSVSSPLRRIELAADGSVAGLRMAGKDGEEGELVQADVYVSAMSVDALKLLLPDQWRPMPFFAQLNVRGHTLGRAFSFLSLGASLEERAPKINC